MWWYELPALAAAATVFPREYLKRKPGRRRAWARQRWARELPPPHDVWIHAVSVGECISALPVVRELEAMNPGLRIAVSTVTDTGFDIASERLPGHHVFYIPWDVPHLLRRTLQALRPRVLVIMETEIWPGLLNAADRAGVPVVLLNGRISDRSFTRYMKVRFLIRGSLQRLARMAMQSGVDRDRIVAMGAPAEKAVNLGNIKYDLEVPAKKDIPWLAGIPSPRLVAGSTHRGEEEGVLEVYRSLRTDFPSLRLILVPRHPERFDEVEDTIRKAGFDCIRRTEISDTGNPGIPADSVILVDRMGELAGIYGMADIVFLGGSLVPVGGHNILEAVVWRKPVLVGPHMWNFREMTAAFREAGGLIQVSTWEEFEFGLRSLLGRPETGRSMGEQAYQILKRNRGSSRSCAELVGRYLETSSDAP